MIYKNIKNEAENLILNFLRKRKDNYFLDLTFFQFIKNIKIIQRRYKGYKEKKKFIREITITQIY